MAAQTGRPLGSVQRLQLLRDGQDIGSVVAVTTVDEAERLPPTPENLAKLAR